MTQRAFAVGDIHGQKAALADLLYKLRDKAGLSPERDKLIFLGDYVDGCNAETDARAVLRFLRSTEPFFEHQVCLMGNHERMLLDVLDVGAEPTYAQVDGWWHQGGFETAQSYMPPGEEASLFNLGRVRQRMGADIDWLRQRPYIYEWGDYIFVHAGIDPDAGLNTADIDKVWIRDTFITYPNEIVPGKTIVFGHTWQPEPLVQPFKIGIDTMHHHGGHLTAVELHPSREVPPRFWTSS